MHSSINGVTSALLHCTSALCAALDHFISDWMFQLRLQSEILSISEPKKIVYSRLVEEFLKTVSSHLDNRGKAVALERTTATLKGTTANRI